MSTDSTALGDRMKADKQQAAVLFAGGASAPEVSRALGILRTTAYSWLYRWRDRGTEGLLERQPKFAHEALTQLESDVLDGLMLGDGCLSMGRHSRNPCLHITRVATDLEYLEWTAKVFAVRLTNASIRVRHVPDARTGKTYHSARLRTRCDPAFLAEWQRWYPNGTKVVPDDLRLSTTAVAVWLADDGYIGAASRRCPEIRFATHGFGLAEVRKLATLLSERYDSTFPVSEESVRGQFTVRAYGPAARALLRDVDPAFPPLDRKSDRWRGTDLLRERVPPPACPRCASTYVNYWTKSRKGVQSYKCMGCIRVFQEIYERPGRDPRGEKGTSR